MDLLSEKLSHEPECRYNSPKNYMVAQEYKFSFRDLDLMYMKIKALLLSML